MTNKNHSLNELIALEMDARKFGFDWPNREVIIEQAISECNEISRAIADNESSARIQEEIGDLIHTAVSLCIFAGFDTEETIAKVTQKFAKRMDAVKALARQHGLNDLQGKPFEFLLELWNQAKK